MKRGENAGAGRLTDTDFERLIRGEVTQADLASRCDVTRQSISKAVRRWKQARKSQCVAVSGNEVEPSCATAAKDIAFTGEDAAEVAKSAAMAGLVASHNQLTSDPPPGPAAIKSLVGAVERCVSILQALGGVVVVHEATEALPELVVRVISPEEEAAFRAEQEAQAS